MLMQKLIVQSKHKIISRCVCHKGAEMNIDDTYLRRYIKNLSIKIKYKQSPNLLCLFRHTDVTSDLCEVNESTPSKSAYLTPFISTDEAFESQRIRQLQARYRDTITRLSTYIEMRDPLG